MRISSRLPVRIVLAVAAFAFGARAESRETVALEFETVEGCPERGALVSEVRARTDRADIVEDATAARTFRIRIRRTGKEYVGELSTVFPERTAPRSIGAGDCSEVTSAMAITFALALDPHARFGPLAPKAAPPPPPPSSPPPQEPTAPPEVRDTPPKARSVSSPVGTAFGGYLLGATGLGASPSLGAALAFEVERRGPGMRPSAELLLGALQDVTGDATTFPTRWFAAGLRACPHAFEARLLQIRLCLEGLGGVLDAASRNIERPKERGGAWLTVGATARTLVALSSRVRLELAGGPGIPLLRPSLVIDPIGAVHRTAPVIALATLGIQVAP